MALIAAHMLHVFEAVLGSMWALSAFMLFWTMKNAKTNMLRPVRLFGFVLSILWAILYYVAASQALSQFAIGAPSALHALAGGLLFVTILFLLLIMYTSRRVLRQLGAD